MLLQRANYATVINTTKDCSIFGSDTQPLGRKQKMNHAAKVFLERAKEYDEMIGEANDEYRIGMRHLANMMGTDPDTFTQQDADVRNIFYS